MLELMLTRVYETSLVTSPNLKFLVLDELHTYRGRQGADVALLIRKLKQRCRKDLLCIGTSAGHLQRRTPISLIEGAKKLAEEVYDGDSGQELALKRNYEQCLDVLRKMFLWSSKVKGLPFRLHQFISQGGSVYATLEPHQKRQLTLEGQYKTEGERLLFPLVFCRECGQDYSFLMIIFGLIWEILNNTDDQNEN